jgi:hypothetical protein
MKKHLFAVLAALGCSLALYSTASAQTALFIYDDGSGVPNAGTYHPGDSFTFSINLAFTPGGAVANLEGLSYWFQQKTPAGAPFNFSITLRDVTGSGFTDLQTPSLSYPQTLNPSNANDLGAALPVGQPADGAGTYFVANITVSIDPNAPITGTYVLSNTIGGGKTSVISDNAGHAFAIPEADYTITLVPEPATWAAGILAIVGFLFSQRRRFGRLLRTA